MELNNFGIFRLDQRSNLVLRDASRRLAEMERSGEWVDTRHMESDEDEGIR